MATFIRGNSLKICNRRCHYDFKKSLSVTESPVYGIVSLGTLLQHNHNSLKTNLINTGACRNLDVIDKQRSLEPRVLAMESYLDSMPSEFYLTGMTDLLDQCLKCADVKGDCIENGAVVLPVSFGHHTELQNFLIAPRSS